MDFIYYLTIFALIYYIAVIHFTGDLYDGKITRKRILKITDAIEHASGDTDSLKFRSQDMFFTIRIENEKASKGLYYTSPAYVCKNIYINDELVCKIHTLINPLSKKYTLIEYSSSRHKKEICSLIKDAYRSAVKLEKEYYEQCRDDKYREKSFFN